jgi:hypothetical protein
VQLDERIRVEPVPAGCVAAIDERDVHVRVIDERVGERHAHGSCADDEIVGFQRSHHADGDCLIERDDARLERKIPTIDQGPHEAPDPLFYALLSRLPVTLREPWCATRL